MTPEEARARGFDVTLLQKAQVAEPVPPPIPAPVPVNVTVENVGLEEALEVLKSIEPKVEFNYDDGELVQAVKSRRLVESCDVEHVWERGFPILTKITFNYQEES